MIRRKKWCQNDLILTWFSKITSKWCHNDVIWKNDINLTSVWQNDVKMMSLWYLRSKWHNSTHNDVILTAFWHHFQSRWLGQIALEPAGPSARNQCHLKRFFQKFNHKKFQPNSFTSSWSKWPKTVSREVVSWPWKNFKFKIYV